MALKLALGVVLSLTCTAMVAEARSDLHSYGAVPVEGSPQFMEAYNRALARCLPEAGLAEASAIPEISLPAVQLRACLYRKGFYYPGGLCLSGRHIGLPGVEIGWRYWPTTTRHLVAAR